MNLSLKERERKKGREDRYAHGGEFKSQWPVNINASSNER